MGCGASTKQYTLCTDMDTILRRMGNSTGDDYLGFWQLKQTLEEKIVVQHGEDCRSEAITNSIVIGGDIKLVGLSVVEVGEIVVVENDVDHPILVGAEKRNPSMGPEMARQRMQQTGPGVLLRARIVYPAGWISLANTGMPDSPGNAFETPEDMANFWKSAERFPSKYIWLQVKGCKESKANGHYRLEDKHALGVAQMRPRGDYPVWRRSKVFKNNTEPDCYMVYAKSNQRWTISGTDNYDGAGSGYSSSSSVPWAGYRTPTLDLVWDNGAQVGLPDARKGKNILVEEPGKGGKTNIGQVKWQGHDGSAIISFCGVDKLVKREHVHKSEVVGGTGY